MIEGLQSLVRRVGAPTSGTTGTRSPRALVRSSGPIAVTVAVIAASLFAVGVGSSSAATPTITAVSAGQFHSCALTSTGGVKCWGDNAFGQIGDGTTTARPTPVDVTGLTSGVTAISAGQYHTCALTTVGGVKCWGDNSVGALGDGTTTTRTTPVDVTGLTSGVVAISAGYFHTCALMDSGAVKCWGFNVYGALGDGTNTTRLTPVAVSGLTSGVAAITSGQYHSCALTTAGGVKCWGYNAFGAIGDGTTTNRTAPVDVSGLGTGVSAVSAGGYHTCAVANGGAKCWGYGGTGQIGDGTTATRSIPVGVLGLASGVTAISAGQYHTCAVANGGAKCWGYNAFGEVGDGTTTDRLTPVDVTGLSAGVAGVSAGGYQSCALITGGGVDCWGYNGSGQVGDGSRTTRPTPQVVFAPAPRQTSTTLVANAGRGEFGSGSTVSASLTSAGTAAPIAGKQLTFTLDGVQTCTTVTDGNGNAACAITPQEPAGTYRLDVSFAGDADFVKSTGSNDFVVSAVPTTLAYAGPTVIADDGPATLAAVLADDNAAPVSGRTVTLTLGTGASAQSCDGVTDAGGVARCGIDAVHQPLGSGTVTAAFATDGFYQSANDTQSTLVFDPDTRGLFVVGDKSSSGSVTLWSAQWAKANSLSGGVAPASFKGFETSMVTPVCGTTWRTGPGDSPAATVMSAPTYIPVVVAGTIVKSGSTVSGNSLHIVIVRTDASSGSGTVTGSVVGQLC